MAELYSDNTAVDAESKNEQLVTNSAEENPTMADATDSETSHEEISPDSVETNKALHAVMVRQSLGSGQVEAVKETNESVGDNADTAPASGERTPSVSAMVQQSAQSKPDGAANSVAAEEVVPAANIPEEQSKQTAQIPAALGGLALVKLYDSSGSEASENEETSGEDQASEDNMVAMKSTAIPVPTYDLAYRGILANSSGESDSDLSSDSTTSDSDSSDGGDRLAHIRAKLAQHEDDDGEEDEEEPKSRFQGKRKQVKVRGEVLLEDLPPVAKLELTVQKHECALLGHVQSIVDLLVVISSVKGAQILDTDTVLFLREGSKALGVVFDVFGQVHDPLYCVRFNSEEHITEFGVKIGEAVYYAPNKDFTMYVILDKLQALKFTDASWEHDVEAPEGHTDYSDDEQEQQANLRRNRMKKLKNSRNEQKDFKRPRRSETESASRATTSYDTSNRTAITAATYGSRNSNQNHNYPQEQKPSSTSTTNNMPAYYQQHYAAPATGAYIYPPNYSPNSWHSNYYPMPPTSANTPPTMYMALTYPTAYAAPNPNIMPTSYVANPIVNPARPLYLPDMSVPPPALPPPPPPPSQHPQPSSKVTPQQRRRRY